MFTIKLYTGNGFREVVSEAKGFTILRGPNGGAEITLHRAPGPNGEFQDERVDVLPMGRDEPGWPARYECAIIENAAGKTTEVIRQGAPSPGSRIMGTTTLSNAPEEDGGTYAELVTPDGHRFMGLVGV